ncbi:MAG: SAM domain-containing protein, partial [archaeon]|nr:SAM domain-containing protein [archaeon]
PPAPAGIRFKFTSVPFTSSLSAKEEDLVRTWTVEQVVDWLQCNDLAILAPHFRENKWDGQSLLSLKGASLIPADTKLGVRKAFIRCHQYLCRSVIDPMDDSAFASVEEHLLALKEHLLRQVGFPGSPSSTEVAPAESGSVDPRLVSVRPSILHHQ